MSEKIERSRVNAQHALDAYRMRGAIDPDDGGAIGDLITDLLHLADVRMPNHPAVLLERASEQFEYEVDPANANEHV